MKTIKYSSIFIVIILVEWLLLSTIVYLVNDISFKKVLTLPIILLIMFFLGWIIPALSVDEIMTQNKKKL